MKLWLVYTQKRHGPRANPASHRRKWVTMAVNEDQVRINVGDKTTEPIVKIMQIDNTYSTSW